jgi:hypothetical protein
MGVKRRQFLRLVLGVGTALTASLLRRLGRARPVRYVEAIRTTFYPGAGKVLDKADITRPGRWGG